MSIIYEVRMLQYELADIEHDCTAAELTGAICSLLGEIVLRADSECELLSDWEDAIKKLRCEMMGGHEWDYDHCGYWGHKYCIPCGTSQYPELGKLSCREARERIGNITEEEYLKSREEIEERMTNTEEQPVPLLTKAIGVRADRLGKNRQNRREVAFVQEWHKEHSHHDLLDLLLQQVCSKDDPDRIVKLLGNAVGDHFKRPLGETTERDRVVAETVIQWLGSNCGHSFMIEALRREGYKIENKHEGPKRYTNDPYFEIDQKE